ncbi:hypothetical protein GCM10010357_13260 [Streptomyces luteireticuli]|uniref:Uncharacterized protein n=1 Tax=Streptomyces luteireticuli TaxID=173858 RepID=A0ABP3I990_9ACTN
MRAFLPSRSRAPRRIRPAGPRDERGTAVRGAVAARELSCHSPGPMGGTGESLLVSALAGLGASPLEEGGSLLHRPRGDGCP